MVHKDLCFCDIIEPRIKISKSQVNDIKISQNSIYGAISPPVDRI
jgi:hypothetical protein